MDNLGPTWRKRLWNAIAWVGAGPDDCWLWTGYVMPNGYGQMAVGQQRYGTKRMEYAHRLAYLDAHGPIPEGYEIDHLCRVRRCCNPMHLEAVTHRENNIRSDSVSSFHARKTNCPRGHAYEGDNLIWRNGSRYCRACRCIQKRASYQRKKQAQ